MERKAGDGSKRRDVLLVRVSKTLRNCYVFVDEFVDARLFESGCEKTTESCVRTEYAMLLCLSYCAQSLTLARGMLSDCRNSSRENQNNEVILVMHLLGVSRCAGDIGKSSVNSMKMCVCGIGKRRVF